VIRWLIAILTWLADDGVPMDVEALHSYASVAASYASFATPEAVPDEDDDEDAEGCCGECGGKGYIVMPDGHRVACPCPADCECKAPSKGQPSKANCPDGKCPLK